MRFTPPYDIDYSQRTPSPDVDELFYQRWSPRSLKKALLPDDVVTTVLDAARWSPSAFNEQPWLFITSSTEDEFNTFLDLLTETNRSWAKDASLLGFIFAKRNHAHNSSPNRLSFFDCGAAWMAMTLQARKFGLYTHGLGGILRDKTYGVLNVPEDIYEVICGFTLGVIDMPEKLEDEFKARESPSPRKSLNEIWKKGQF
ncbi:nitroreductase family protein [bacterium]|nr:nitroreductase family protein [bacterium]